MYWCLCGDLPKIGLILTLWYFYPSIMLIKLTFAQPHMQDSICADRIYVVCITSILRTWHQHYHLNPAEKICTFLSVDSTWRFQDKIIVLYFSPMRVYNALFSGTLQSEILK